MLRIPLKPKNGLTPISCHAALERGPRVRLSLERKGAWSVSTPQASTGNQGKWGTQRLFPVWRKSASAKARDQSQDSFTER